jgi:hypothetical protein
MVKDFEDWWVKQDTMFGSTVNAMYGFCEETGLASNELHYEYYNEEVS